MDAAAGRAWRPLAACHRWIGLALGAWLALLGVTGSALVWHDELDAWLNPGWFAPRPPCAAPPAAPVVAALERFAAATGGARATMVAAPRMPGAAYVVWERAGADGPRRQHFVDVGCDRYLGMRTWGAARLDRAHLVPAAYELHRSLLAGETGHAVVGAGALVLLALAASGLALAWPRAARRQRWARALTVRRGPALRVGFELHRALGLWLLPFLLPMAVTGAYLCFPQPGRAVVAAFLPTVPSGRAAPSRADDPARAGAPALPPDALVRAAEAQWRDARWSRLQFPDARRAHYEVRLLRDGEPRKDTGDTRVRLTAQGEVLGVRDALDGPAGETVLRWLFPLHSGEALGTAGRLAWTAFGAVPAVLFATAAWVWWRRSRSRARRVHGVADGRADRSWLSAVPRRGRAAPPAAGRRDAASPPAPRVP